MGFDHLPQSVRPCLHEAAARQGELAIGEQSPVSVLFFILRGTSPEAPFFLIWQLSAFG